MDDKEATEAAQAEREKGANMEYDSQDAEALEKDKSASLSSDKKENSGH